MNKFVATFTDESENAGGYLEVSANGFYTVIDKITSAGFYSQIQTIERGGMDDESGQFFPLGCIQKL